MGAFHHPNPQKKGCINAKGGYFMNQDLSRFDAPFFNITEQEALAMGETIFSNTPKMSCIFPNVYCYRPATTAATRVHIRGT